MKLKGRELDFAIYKLLTGKDRADWSLPIKYHSSLDAVRPVVEKCVEECGLDAYLDGLLLTCSHPYLVFATAEEQCRAVLLAYLRKEEAGS